VNDYSAVMTRPHRLDPDARHRVADRLVAGLEHAPGIAFAYLHGSFLSDLPFRDIDIARARSDSVPGYDASRQSFSVRDSAG
jgi:hypothetical protein